MHPAHWLRVAGLALGGTQADDLIGQDWPGSRLLLDNLIARVAFEPGHKPDGVLVQLVKPGIIQVGPVKDQQIARLKAQALHGLEVMGLTVRDQDTLGQQAAEDGMQLDGPPLRVRNLAQGNTAAHRSMVVASMILICGAFWGWGANSAESRSYSL